MKIKFLLASIAIVAYYSSTAQSFRTFNFFNYDPKLINPAFTGLTTTQDYQVQYSRNYDKSAFDHSYSFEYTAMTAASIRLAKLNSGLGVVVWRNTLGPLTETSGSLLYNYQIKLSDKGRLSIGTQIGYSDTYIDGDKYRVIQTGDPVIPSGKKHFRKGLIGDFGIAYRGKKLYAGISTTNLIQTANNKVPGRDYYPPGPVFIRSYSLYAQYEFNLTYDVKLQPSVLIQTDKSSPSFLLNEVFTLRNRFMIGAGETFYDKVTIVKLNTGVILLERIQLLIGGGYDFASSGKTYEIDGLLHYRILK